MKRIEEVKKGTRIGRHIITKCYNLGPFAYVSTQCTCPAKTKRKRVPFGTLTAGNSLSCGCWKKELLKKAFAPMRRERDKIRRRFMGL